MKVIVAPSFFWENPALCDAFDAESAHRWRGGAFQQGLTALLLVDAFLGPEGRPLALSGCWRLWLQRAFPDAHFLVAGWWGAASFGYVDLWQVPAEPWARALPVAEAGSWAVYGQDGVGLVRRSVDGHGQDSLLKGLSRLGALLDTLLMLESDGQRWASLWASQTDALTQLAQPLWEGREAHCARLGATPLAPAAQQASEVATRLWEALEAREASLSQAMDWMAALRNVKHQLTTWQRQLAE